MRVCSIAALMLMTMVLVNSGTAHAILMVTSTSAPVSPSFSPSRPDASPGRPAPGSAGGVARTTAPVRMSAASGSAGRVAVRPGVPLAGLGLLGLVACLAVLVAVRRGRRRLPPSDSV